MTGRPARSEAGCRTGRAHEGAPWLHESVRGALHERVPAFAECAAGNGRVVPGTRSGRLLKQS